jgi:hypothetical protein
MGKKGLTPGRINRLFGVLLALFLTLVAIFFWYEQIGGEGLVLIAFLVLSAGILFVFVVRRAQVDGFLDGYSRAENNLKKKEG